MNEEVQKFKKTVQDANKRDIRKRTIVWSLYFIAIFFLSGLMMYKGRCR